MNTKEAADYLGVTPEYIRYLAEGRGPRRLRARKVAPEQPENGNHVRCPEVWDMTQADLDKFRERMTPRGRPKTSLWYVREPGIPGRRPKRRRRQAKPEYVAGPFQTIREALAYCLEEEKRGRFLVVVRGKKGRKHD